QAPVVAKPSTPSSPPSMQFSLGMGPVFVLEATPGVAVGPQINGGFRRGIFSLNVDAHIAWDYMTMEKTPTQQFVTWATALRACAHKQFVFGCGLLQASGVTSLSASERWQNRLGGGLRAGLELHVSAPVYLQFWGEGVAVSKGYAVVRDNTNLSHGLPVVGAFGATVLLTR
ncbi:MAG TPA: hypothetical protein PK156_30550, partial [Polyangium sp.]|nr:hypothetical protein [Polyangium sp.]